MDDEQNKLSETLNKNRPKNKLSNILETAMRQCQEDTGTQGVCLACGEEQTGVEPDARNYECESCGERQVCGCEEILIMLG
jgi:hypothetical protein